MPRGPSLNRRNSSFAPTTLSLIQVSAHFSKGPSDLPLSYRLVIRHIMDINVKGNIVIFDEGKQC